jgi:hypothetical protein
VIQEQSGKNEQGDGKRWTPAEGNGALSGGRHSEVADGWISSSKSTGGVSWINSGAEAQFLTRFKSTVFEGAESCQIVI